MLKFKIGNKIKIKSWEQLNKEHYYNKLRGDITKYKGSLGPFFAADMRKYCGETLTIWRLEDKGYLVKEDNQGYIFCDWMIEFDKLQLAAIKIKEEIGLC